MKMLHQTVDGTIWVRSNAGHYGETPDIFERDHGKKLPPLPAGITERIYEPGVRHALYKGNDTVDGGPMPWPPGDEAIAKTDQLLAKKKKREEDKLAADKAKVEQ